MHAEVGDQIVVDGASLGDLPREGEVLEVLETGGVTHYRVRWDDNGHETVFYPGSTAHVVHTRRRRAAR
jgi:hypothetical protein